MTQGNATLVLDLGNSETRGVVLFGKDMQTGVYREKAFVLSNRFSEVNSDYMPTADYSEDTSTVMHINAQVLGSEFKGTYVNGEVQFKELNVAPLRPSATEKKYNSATTALSFELAILYAYKAIKSMVRASSIESLDITWDVVVLLPPGDIDIGKDQIIALLQSITELNCSFPRVQMPIKLHRVTVLPEGFCAYIGAVYDRGRKIRPNMGYLLKETTLVCDVGAGTTDILVIKDNKIIDSSKHTINRGGNNVTQLVRRELRKQDLNLAESDIMAGVVSGFVKDGARNIDITEIINKAKSDIARQLVADMQGYLEETEIPIRSIGRILVCGGGALGGSGNTKTLSEEVVSYLKRLSPNVELVELPMHDVQIPDEEGVLHKQSLQISPRDLNVLGASVLAEMY